MKKSELFVDRGYFQLIFPKDRNNLKLHYVFTIWNNGAIDYGFLDPKYGRIITEVNVPFIRLENMYEEK